MDAAKVEISELSKKLQQSNTFYGEDLKILKNDNENMLN